MDRHYVLDSLTDTQTYNIIETALLPMLIRANSMAKTTLIKYLSGIFERRSICFQQINQNQVLEATDLS